MALNMKWLSGLWGSKTPEVQESAPIKDRVAPVSTTNPVSQVAAAVLSVDQDPRLKAAEADARNRFSEFTTTFLNGTGADFAVKAHLVANGASEHIWVRVKSIQGNRISGELGNKPVNLAEMTLGSKVELELNQVEDWMFTRSGKREGLFTKPVLQQMEKERNGTK